MLPHLQRSNPRGHLRRTLRAFLVATLVTAVCVDAAPPTARLDRETLRLGFSQSMFTGVNENDAQASIKALATVMLRDRGLPADPDPALYSGTDAIATAVRQGEVDAVGLTAEEYWVLAKEVGFDRFTMAVRDNDPTEQYLLLVNRASGVTDLAGLRGKRLSIFLNSRMVLGKTWLEVELAKAGLPAIAEHFGTVIEHTKLSKTVLEVFFRQADACVATRQGFTTMCELNPPLGQQLVVLAHAPAMVPALFAFRANLKASVKESALHEMSYVHTSAAGQQALMIFQVGQATERPASDLATALALMDEYSRLRPAACAAKIHAMRIKQPAGSPAARP